MEIHLTINGKVFQTLDRSNFDFNKPFDAFICHVNDIIAIKSKQSSNVIEASEVDITWRWLTVAKSQQKNLPPFNSFDAGPVHYDQMRSDIRNTSYKNPDLRNMVMRVNCVACIRETNIRPFSETGPATTALASSSVNNVGSQSRRVVSFVSNNANGRQRHHVRGRHLHPSKPRRGMRTGHCCANTGIVKNTRPKCNAGSPMSLHSMAKFVSHWIQVISMSGSVR